MLAAACWDLGRVVPAALVTPDSSAWPSLLLITFFSAATLGCTNAAIARLAAPLQQVLAALNPVLTSLLELVVSGQLKAGISGLDRLGEGSRHMCTGYRRTSEAGAAGEPQQ